MLLSLFTASPDSYRGCPLPPEGKVAGGEKGVKILLQQKTGIRFLVIWKNIEDDEEILPIMMKSIWRCTGVVCALTIAGACNSSRSEKEIPLEVFFGNPEKTAFEVSPSGKFVSYMQPWRSRMNIYVRELATNQVTQVTKDTLHTIKHCWWASDEKLVYLKDDQGNEVYHLYGANRDGSDAKCMTPYRNSKVIVHDTRSDSIVLIGLNKRDPRVFDFYRLNVNTGEMEEALQNPGDAIWWLADSENQIRLITRSDGINETLWYREKESQPFRQVMEIPFGETVRPVCYSKINEDQVLAMSNLNRDKIALVSLDLRNGTERKVIYQHKEVDLNRAILSGRDKRLLCTEYVTWKHNLHFIDSTARKFYSRLQGHLPGKEFTITSRDTSENRFIIHVYSDRSPGTYYLYDRREDKLSRLGDVNPRVNPDDMAEMKPVTYQASDGTSIHAYLTLPKGKEAKSLPLVAIPHPDPRTRNKWEYDPEAQFLANRGYAVLQMNYRGSAGYGKAFMEAAYKQWGGKVQDDIKSGVEWLIDKGIADSSRVAIYGFDFGGYSALMGAIKYPGLYRCAISYSGLTNLFSYLKDVPPYYKLVQERIYKMVGDPEQDIEMLREASPIFQTDKIRIPLLIAQGVKDRHVHENETAQFVDKLRAKGVEVHYLLNESEAHNFRNEESRLEFYAALERFLAKNMQ